MSIARSEVNGDSEYKKIFLIRQLSLDTTFGCQNYPDFDHENLPLDSAIYFENQVECIKYG